MGTTVRLRFVAFELADGWVELQRKGPWNFTHPDRKGQLVLSMFPLAKGVTMNLELLRLQSRQSGSIFEGMARRSPRMRGFFPRSFLLDETSWTAGPVFCVAKSARTEPGNRVFGPLGAIASSLRSSCTRQWAISDGVYLLDAMLEDPDENHFRLSANEADSMLRSVRFEGPS